ncbi:hypothetical protein [Sphaerisporangium aureirubrum]|uniref:Uncharacterized protein n=1 Tax=Sphaerisporangium aureirubrum TaxID=1544736 RepID=A0ABW1NW04_9ACTN
MSQERYVTSAAIEGIVKEIDEDVLPAIRRMRALIDTTGVPFPGWGAVGELLVGVPYGRVQDDVREKFAEAEAVLEAWAGRLETARRNWRTAEEQSTVVYV